MNKVINVNIMLLLSICFFLTTNAFTYYSHNNMVNEIEYFEEFEEVFELAVSSCMTCELGSNGEPGDCKVAAYCGLTGCSGNCELVGVLCGECADECGGMSCNEQ